MMLLKAVYDKLVTKVNAVDTSRFNLENQYNTNKSVHEKSSNGADKKYLILVDLLKRSKI